LWSHRTHVPLRPLRTNGTNKSLLALRTFGPLRTDRTSKPLFTLRSNGTCGTNRTRDTLFARLSSFTLGTWVTLGTLGTSGTPRPWWPGNAVGPGGTCGTLFSHRALRTFGPDRTRFALRPLRTGR